MGINKFDYQRKIWEEVKMTTTRMCLPCMNCGENKILYDIDGGDDYENCIGKIWWCFDCIEKRSD